MRRSILALMVVAILGPPLARVSAQQAEYPGESLLLIMDSSGSMNRVDDEGAALIDGAKQALRVLVSALPEDAHVGLRVYGHRVPNTDRANGCLDTELVIPVGPVDEAAMIEAIDSYDAVGYTPIGLSLREAAQDLPPAGRRTIILVSDGIDTCAPPDPCEVAAELDAEGLNVRVHTVGLFLTDPAAEQQLRCIADATGGEFRRVDSLIDLVRDLTGIAAQSLTDGPGRVLPVVIGSLERMTAPVLSLQPPEDPGSQEWSAGAVSTIATGETRWFAVDVEETGTWQLQFSAHLPWQLEPEDGEYFEVEIYDATGAPIGSPHEVLGVIVDTPQRIYLSDAAEYRLFGESVAATSVTDAASAPPGWPGDQADDPFMARIRDRFLAAGVNGGLYDLWKWQYLGEPLTQGRYYAGVTWSADRQAATEMGVGAVVFPAGDGAPPRDRPTGFALMPGASSGEDRVEPAFGDWTGGRLGGDTPRRAAEVWTRVAVGDPVTYSVWLEEGEVLEIGIQGGSPYRNHGLSFEVRLATEEGVPVRDLRDDTDHGIRLTGYPQGGLWEASSSGTYGLTIEANAADPGDENLAAIIAMFVFTSDPEPIVATTTTRPDQSAQESEEHEERGETPLGLVIAAAGVVLLGGAAGAWWFRRRRR